MKPIVESRGSGSKHPNSSFFLFHIDVCRAWCAHTSFLVAWSTRTGLLFLLVRRKLHHTSPTSSSPDIRHTTSLRRCLSICFKETPSLAVWAQTLKKVLLRKRGPRGPRALGLQHFHCKFSHIRALAGILQKKGPCMILLSPVREGLVEILVRSSLIRIWELCIVWLPNPKAGTELECGNPGTLELAIGLQNVVDPKNLFDTHTHTLAQKHLIELLMWNASHVQKHFS